MKAARTHAGRLVEAYGSPDRRCERWSDACLSERRTAGRDRPGACSPSRSRGSGRSSTLVRALADGDVVLDPGCDWNRAREQLLALPGIGPWTAEVIAMRGLGDPDAFPVTDLGVLARRQAARSARRPARAHRTQCPLATVARLRDPTPVDRTRTRRQRLAAQDDREGEVMETLQVPHRRQPGRSADAGRQRTAGCRHLRMVDQTYEPSRDGLGGRRRRLRRRRRAAGGVLRRRTCSNSTWTSTWSAPNFNAACGPPC